MKYESACAAELASATMKIHFAPYVSQCDFRPMISRTREGQ